MNIIFLTVIEINSINERGIYTDLLRYFKNRGHNIYIVSPSSERTYLIHEDNVKILKVKTGKLQKNNAIEKVLSQILLERQYIRAIRNYFKDEIFNLILYATPPITLLNVVKYLKKFSNGISYLLLKDIFPQNAVDLSYFSKTSIIYKYFRKKEIDLYSISDYIGCMSEANKEYILQNNLISDNKVEINPNSIEVNPIIKIDDDIRKKILQKFNVPKDKYLYIYGGNLGKPQGIDFLLNVIKANESRDSSYIWIIGSGTEYSRIDAFFKENKINNSKLTRFIPKSEYEKIIGVADIGLIFLDSRFTIPNFPSRLLSYMQNSLPILCATDRNTDIGEIIENNEFGLWVESDVVEVFLDAMNKLESKLDLEYLGNNSYRYLKENYDVSKSYEIIMEHFKGDKYV